MGASSGACCSGSQDQGGDKCCGSNKVLGDQIGAPVAGKPLPSSELLGIDNLPSPGWDCKAEIGESNDGGTALATKGAVPGGDSAAGGREEHQIVTYGDGSQYMGQIVDGKRHGQGKWESKSGMYEGQWQADVQHGKGRQTWSDGRVYDGQFQNGKFAGSGRMVWETQRGLLTYEGAYQDDLKHGKGKFVWADGRTYDGYWERGKRHGRGTYTNARHEQKIGYWVDDKFEKWEDATDAKAAALEANANLDNEPR